MAANTPLRQPHQARQSADDGNLPGTPRLLRAINERAALETLLEHGALPRTRISTLTGLSKPTASQLIDGLLAAGLVRQAGVATGGPGPSALLYEIDPTCGYVAGVDVTNVGVTASVADVTGQVVAELTLPARGRTAAAPASAVERVRAALEGATQAAGIGVSDLVHAVIGLPGAVDPNSGRVGYARDLAGWHETGLLDRIREDLGIGVDFENDANLAAVAELYRGQAGGFRDFVMIWVAEGIGMAIVIDGEFWRGAAGGAGEIGYMPVPGTPVVRNISRSQNGGFQLLAGGPAVVRLARAHGIAAAGGDPAAAVELAAQNADDAASAAFLDELAERVATGLAVVASVIDPPLVVLTGKTLRAGGDRLRGLISRDLRSMAISRPQVLLSSVDGNPVLAGALQAALRVARETVFTRKN